jgi:hypothetical protein
MDFEKEILALNAEKMAIQNILVNVLYRLGRTNPALEIAIRQGFDDAANMVEQVAIAHGKAARPEHLVRAIKIVEELRPIALGRPDKPRREV